MEQNELKIRILEECNLSESQLLQAIGADLQEESFNVRPKSPEDLIQSATEFLNRRRRQIQDTVCNNEKIKVIKSDEGETSNITIITAIADLIASIVVGVSPITVAVLLVKRGLRNLCGDT